MMTPEHLTEFASDGRAAVSSFLETILGETVPVQIKGPGEISSDVLEDQFQRCYAILGRSRNSEPFIVLIDKEWLPFLSNAMLGEKLTEWNDESDDFLGEMATQFYATLQQTLDTSNVAIPDSTFTILPEVVALPSELLTDQLLKLSIILDTAEKNLEGHLLVPYKDTEETIRESGTQRPESQTARESRAEGSTKNPDGGASAQSAAQQAGPAPASEIRQQEPEEEKVDVAFPSFPDFGNAPDDNSDASEARKFELLGDVEIELAVELGRRKMQLEDILRLTNGSIVELDKLAGEPLQIYANNRLIAEGEAVVIDDQFGVRITRLASSKKRARALL